MQNVENKGTPVPDEAKRYFLGLAREDPTLTNAELSERTWERFGRRIDKTAIGAYRRKAGIPSSSTARSEVSKRPLLSESDRRYLDKLVSKLVVPEPDSIRFTETLWDVGFGYLKNGTQEIWIRHRRGVVQEVWLKEHEITRLIAMLPFERLRRDFDELLATGKKTLGLILAHNRMIQLGGVGVPFWEIRQLLETRKPDSLTGVDRDANALLNAHVELAKSVEQFKLEIERAWAPPIVRRQ